MFFCVLFVLFLCSFCVEIERMRRRSETNLRGYSARDKMAEAAELEKVCSVLLFFLSVHQVVARFVCVVLECRAVVKERILILFFEYISRCTFSLIVCKLYAAPLFFFICQNWFLCCVLQQAKHQEFDKSWTEDTRYA